MTILEWMKASTRFSFEDINLKSIALGREINDTSVEVTTLATREKELLRADMILFVFIGSPSSIASESILHNNFQLMIDIQKEKPISFPDIIDII